LKEQTEGHKKLAELLLEREVIFSEDLEHIFGKRPWDKKLIENENGQDKEEKKEAPEKPESKDENAESKPVSA
jgi:cell division protease FtsH